jgi:hypothetical protein
VKHPAEPAGDDVVGHVFEVEPRRMRCKRDHVCTFVVVHLIAALAVFPYFFS